MNSQNYCLNLILKFLYREFMALSCSLCSQELGFYPIMLLVSMRGSYVNIK